MPYTRAKLLLLMARTKDFDENEVLSKAVNLFWLKGYNATSMQDLVDELGISRSSLYDTYGDKHTLYLKALESYQAAGSVNFNNIVSNAPSAKTALKNLLEYILSNLVNDACQRGCFLVNAELEVAPQDAEVSKMICENYRQLEEVFYTTIKKGQDSGEISNSQDARALARFVSTTVKGMQVTSRSIKDKAVFDDVISLTLSVLK